MLLCAMIIENCPCNGNMYDNVMEYLKMNNDIDVENVLFVDGEKENPEFEDLFGYITMEEKDLLFESFLPVSYVQIALENSILRLMDALSRSEKGTLIFVYNLQPTEYSRMIFEQLTEDLLQRHIWLFWHPLSNITESNFRNQMISNELEKALNLKLNSQVPFFFFISFLGVGSILLIRIVRNCLLILCRYTFYQEMIPKQICLKCTEYVWKFH